jgi:hypothetical protein
MRRLTALATLALLFAVAACTGDGGNDDDKGQESSEGPAAPTAPLELTIEPPTGFTADTTGADREIFFSENHKTYTFFVAGAEGGMDRIMVTSYLLNEGVDASTYESQATLTTDYFKQLDQLTSIDNFYPTLVHRQEGIYRYGEKVINEVEIKWQDHFVFAGPYLINITCMWDAHFAQVEAGCAELTASFPFPEEWNAAKAA